MVKDKARGKETQKKQKEIRCVVVSDKMDKSRAAKIEELL